jgi:hypothetical protein
MATIWLWGLLGAGTVELIELYGAVRRARHLPWRLKGEARLSVYLLSVMLRLGLGALAGELTAAAGPRSTVGAFAAGIAAPYLLEQLGRLSTADLDRDSKSREKQIEAEAERIAATRKSVRELEPSELHEVSPYVADTLAARRKDLVGQLRAGSDLPSEEMDAS